MSNRNNDPQTTSGVPPPPTLSFPTMYNGKKESKGGRQWTPATKAPVQWYDPITGRLPQDIHDFVLEVDDFLNLSRANRQRLLEGSVVRLTVDNEFVADIPLRLLLAASQEARNLYLSPPLQPLVHMNISNRLYKDALKLIATWMKANCKKVKAYGLSSQGSFAQDVNMIAVATTLGMDTTVSHVIKLCWAKLKRDPLTLPQLIAIDRAAPGPAFPLLKCVVHRLANELVHGGRNTDDPELVDWMNRCPRILRVLRPQYQQLLSEHRTRKEAKEKKQQEFEEKAGLKATEEMAKKLLDEQHARASRNSDEMKKEREEGRRREQEMREQLQRRLNSGRVNTVTAEEARLIFRRGCGA